MSTKTVERVPERLPARERLLAAADELFYEEGIHTVGIDRVIERAGVAKASLYSSFGSKDALIRAYLQRRHEARQRRLLVGLERWDDPRDKVLGVFDLLGELFAEPTFMGCAFQNASAESPSGGGVDQVCTDVRAWTRGLFADLARDAGVADPSALAVQLQLLYDGATTGSRMDHDPTRAATARAAAAVLLDAALTATP